jgi:hypothetical protein
VGSSIDEEFLSWLGYLLVRFPDAANDKTGIELFAREVIGNTP